MLYPAHRPHQLPDGRGPRRRAAAHLLRPPPARPRPRPDRRPAPPRRPRLLDRPAAQRVVGPRRSRPPHAPLHPRLCRRLRDRRADLCAGGGGRRQTGPAGAARLPGRRQGRDPDPHPAGRLWAGSAAAVHGLRGRGPDHPDRGLHQHLFPPADAAQGGLPLPGLCPGPHGPDHPERHLGGRAHPRARAPALGHPEHRQHPGHPRPCPQSRRHPLHPRLHRDGRLLLGLCPGVQRQLPDRGPARRRRPAAGDGHPSLPLPLAAGARGQLCRPRGRHGLFGPWPGRDEPPLPQRHPHPSAAAPLAGHESAAPGPAEQLGGLLLRL